MSLDLDFDYYHKLIEARMRAYIETGDTMLSEQLAYKQNDLMKILEEHVRQLAYLFMRMAHTWIEDYHLQGRDEEDAYHEFMKEYWSTYLERYSRKAGVDTGESAEESGTRRQKKERS